MKAVVMAGGEGTRLRPMTSLLPKPMVPIVNQPVMEHIIGLVKHHGIDEVVATLAFMPQVIQDYFGEGDEWGMSISYAVEDSPLGTAGSVKNAQSLLPDDEPFIVISGDSLTDIDLSELVRFHKERGGAVTIALKKVEDPLEFGVVITDEDGLVERFLEKPTWGQVFSDTINTGIYVIEPWVLDAIPDDQAYDFSSELFPALMAEGHRIYGMVCDGYWCDVGSRESYLQVHTDILDGKAMLFIPGVHAREGVWVSESATIDPDAKLGNKVVIGENVHVRAGATVGDYVVIDDNCVIGTDARVSHSVLWSDTFVGKQCTVRGAVLCRRVDVRAHSLIDMGATVGAESVVGHGAHIGPDVQVFPYKRIQAGAQVNSSIIWESTAQRAVFTDSGIVGLVGVDITPELALRVAEAYGSVLPKGGHVAVSRDTTRSARMVKRALVAGLNAAGLNVRDLRTATPAVSRFTTQKTRCVGGIHVAGSPRDPQSLDMRFFDTNGLDISPSVQKKVERLYFRGEFRRAFFDEIGEIIYPPRPIEYYTEALKEAVRSAGLGDEWRKIVVDYRSGAGSIVLPLIAHAWNINVVGINTMVDTEAAAAPTEGTTAEEIGQLKATVELFAADAGFIFDWGAERVRILTPGGRLLDGNTALHAMVDLWCRTRGDVEGAIAVPLSASNAVERIAAAYGRQVVRPGRSRRALAQAVVDGRAAFAGSYTGGFIFGDFMPAFDGILSVAMLVRMLSAAGMSLDAVADGLPAFHKRTVDVFCPAERKGAVMRAVTEASTSLHADLSEGVRVVYDDGWALVLPDSSEPTVSIWAEAEDDEAAAARLGEWRALVESAVAEG